MSSPVGGLAADSLGTSQVGSLMFPPAQRFVSEAVLVPNDAIAAAQRTLGDRLRLGVEPGGRPPPRCFPAGSATASGRAGIIVCEANADPATAGG